MTHAARSHKALEEIDDLHALRCHLADALEKIDAVAAREAETARRLNAELVMANSIALMRKIARQSRVSDTDRKAAESLADQLERVA